jgi:hypothetical protein
MGFYNPLLHNQTDRLQRKPEHKFIIYFFTNENKIKFIYTYN